MGAVQLNTRLDEDIKRAGDAVLAEYGVSSTEAIRSLWQYMAQTGTLPDFIVLEEDVYRPTLESAEEGAGMAIRMAQALGMHVSYPEPITNMEAHMAYLDKLKEEAYLEKYGSLMGGSNA